MSYFRKLDEKSAKALDLLRKEDRWLILINADPDALACAMALKRIMLGRVRRAAIGQINVITRPDNLAMIKFLRIPSHPVPSDVHKRFDRFALVDSQPGHNPEFAGFHFSVVLDHHPIAKDQPVQADFSEIRTDYGACSTLLTEYLYALKIEPGRLLATALLYGIKTDTQDFERDFCDVDIKAFRYLNKFADHTLLRKILRSEFHLAWLKHFSTAFRNLYLLPRRCLFVFMGKVQNPDILVVLADFFMRVQEVAWAVIAGVYGGQLVIILRGDGMSTNVGTTAKDLFGKMGSAGGHKAAARAEIPIANLDDGPLEDFLLFKLDPKAKRKRLPRSFKYC